MGIIPSHSFLLPVKKVKSETPTEIRKSPRSLGKAPDSAGLVFIPRHLKYQVVPNKFPLEELGPISMRDVSGCSKADKSLVNKILSVCKESQLKNDDDDDGYKKVSIDVGSMEVASEKTAHVMSTMMSVKLFPSADMRMVVVGNTFGNVGFWNVDSEDEDGDGIYRYNPHPGPISSIVIQPFSMNKIITSCHYGQIRSLDVEKETFGLAYYSEHMIFSMAQRPDDVNAIYFGESQGAVHKWDERSGRLSFSWDLHGCRINTIDFNSGNTNIMATSSSDRTACIWDLRKLSVSKPRSLKVIIRERAVHSAYFSPSGSLLSATSLDDKIGVLSGANYDDEFLIYHDNESGSKWSSFTGVGAWGWDDSYIFVGNINKGVDVISIDERSHVTTLKSRCLTATQCRLDAHPSNPGMLAGGTIGSQVYIWKLASFI